MSAATVCEQEEPDPAASRRLHDDLDEFARRELELVTRKADALGIPDLSPPPGAFAEGSQPAVHFRPPRPPSSARALALVRSLSPEPPRPAFVDAVTTPFHRVSGPPPYPPAPETLEEDTDPTAKVIIDEELLYNDPELSIQTAPVARITWRRPGDPPDR